MTNTGLELQAGAAYSLNYYAGWTIVTASPPAVGTILTSSPGGIDVADTTPLITISWLPAGSTVTLAGATLSGSSTVPTTAATSTTYTLYPPSTSTATCNAAQFTTTGTKCKLYNCPSTASSHLVAAGSDDQTYLKSADATSLVLPTYTFSNNWVYINIENTDTLTGHLVISKNEKTSSRSVSTDPTVSASGCTPRFCNYNGNCIDDSSDGQHQTPYCICSDGYSGADCATEAFSTATTIASSSSILGSVATGYSYGSVQRGSGNVCANRAAGCSRSTETMTAPLTLATGAGTLNYYKGWTIVLSGDVYAEGVIASSTAADPPVITITYTKLPACNTLLSAACAPGCTADGTTCAGTATAVTTTTSTIYTITTNKEVGTMSAALTLETTGSLHSAAVDYYKGWSITTAVPAATGTILTNDGSLVLTVDWETVATTTTTTTATTYVLTPPTRCNTQNVWDASGPSCLTGHNWDSGAKTCERFSSGEQHEWEPWTYIGIGTLQHCTAIANLVTPTVTPADCQALCNNAQSGTCNAFTHDLTSPFECKLFTCPTSSDPVTTAAETKAGSWGVDATAGKKSFRKQARTCCAGATDWLIAPSCTTVVDGYYDEAACESVQGVINQAACEADATVTDAAACMAAPVTTAEATCELKPFDEVPEALCSAAAILAGYDGSTTAKSCDAFDTVSLDCSSQRCTPSASTANPYKIGYVSCLGDVCSINAAKPIVTIPFTVAGLPKYSKVLTYVDSQPYPAKGANSAHYVYNCEAADLACVAKGAHGESTCTETATVSVAATYSACAAESGGTKVACELVAGCTYTAATTTTPHFSDSSIKIYDMEPLPSGKKHTLVIMLLTDDGEPLGTVLKQFEVGYGGGCTIAPDGSVCGAKGACNMGYCVCYDGYFGTSCERNIDEDGSVCAAQSNTAANTCTNTDGGTGSPSFGNYECLWSTSTSLCSIKVIMNGFTAGGVYEARQTSMTTNKIGEARFLNTRMLEANAAEISKSDSALTAGTAGTKTKLETVAATVVATVAASKTATQTNVDLLYAKAERNQIKVQQAKEESLRLQTTNLEAKLEMQRSLADHQTQVQNRFQSKRFDVYKLNALKQDKLKQEFARTRFTLNQLLTSNGPTVDATKFKESTCTTDQFYNVNCVESTTDESDSFAGTGYVSDQLVDLGTTVGTSGAPVIAISGEDVAGTYDDVDRGR